MIEVIPGLPSPPGAPNGRVLRNGGKPANPADAQVGNNPEQFNNEEDDPTEDDQGYIDYYANGGY